MLGLVAAAAAAGVGKMGGFHAEVSHSDVKAVDGALQVLIYFGLGLRVVMWRVEFRGLGSGVVLYEVGLSP